MRDNTLVVCMGRNMVSTLLAICSHKPKHLVLCHTKRDAVVKGHASRICEFAKELGLSSVEVVPFDIDGIFPEQSLPRASGDMDVDVNITPGSKGQGAMLAWWARKRNFTVWSLHNGQRQCEPLHNPGGKAPLPFDLCDPAVYFRLNGMDMLDNSLDEKSLEPVMPAMDALLAFMREAIDAGQEEAVLKYPLKVGDSVLNRPDRDTWELRRDGQKFIYRLGGGKWFEQLCAVALLRAGASHVRVNAAMRWDEKNEYDIVMKKNMTECPHRLELDVVGSFNGDFVLISCKSYSKSLQPGVAIEELEQLAAIEARDTGSSLGRFGLRILAHMHCSKAYMTPDERVMVIGWREICRPEILRQKIAELRATQRSTD